MPRGTSEVEMLIVNSKKRHAQFLVAILATVAALQRTWPIHLTRHTPRRELIEAQGSEMLKRRIARHVSWTRKHKVAPFELLVREREDAETRYIRVY